MYNKVDTKLDFAGREPSTVKFWKDNNLVKKMIEKFGTEYHIIITADHGGHEKFHGTTLKEDMTIPMFFYGNSFVPGKLNKDISLLDIAPTIAKILSIPIESDWEGESVI